MNKMKSFFFIAFAALTLAGLTACQQAPQNTSEARDEDVNKSVVGNEQTGEYADKFATVQQGKTTDPYTASKDKANYAGKEPIANDQTPVDRATKNQ